MFNKIFRYTKRSLARSAENSLESAYQAALTIKNIEIEHFQGKKISSQNKTHSERVFDYFQGELHSNLRAIDLKLSQFKTSQYFNNLVSSNSKQNHLHENNYITLSQSLIIEKLNFIDQIVSKYKQESDINAQKVSNLVKETKNPIIDIAAGEDKKLETVSDKTSVLPRSFLRTLGKIKDEINPDSKDTEEELIIRFRRSKYKTAVSVKFLLLLIIIPILVHNISKIVIGKAFVDPYFANHQEIVFINEDLQEEALNELRIFEENIELKTMIGLIPQLSPEERESTIQEKAQEVAQSYRRQSSNAIKNIFSDILAFLAFAIILVSSRQELQVLKSFLDELIYGLSDSAKAFLIILFTDIFVGFHSPHGWEIVLESVAHHFGLAENRDFNFLFIATFPVILDTVLKYWIFRYLNRISPSAVATYKNMNES
ncbi:proton extrusion protein PcxA [Cyanobacterium stanieri LEGE 03274]|uniref:Proton extrusion protein PxcA n=1 Tax=Cyanobacterium stanieri LEGE 03274 TaxID=1828756 RepID=A0ABR9V4T6_9CHRO|nr:proton extrusion protein PcxA [Cyanobacterium stanieri]MBE9222910.1 proton extrusion protein PcxA [Cyanobacterium stanieri LEGE 03274]